jgi:transposase-like protein
MAKGATTLSEVREQEYTQSIGMVAAGVILIIISVALIAFLNYLVPANILGISRLLCGLATLVGVGLLGAAIKRIMDVRNAPSILYKCPYCEAPNRLTAEPTEDFVCESCHATIRFENGKPVPIRTITCTSCGAQHRVSIKADRYVCDKCNAILQVQQQTQPVYGMAAQATAPPTRQSAVMLGGSNQNLLLQGFDHSRENQVAAILQRELSVDIAEARRLLHTVSEKTPLIVAFDIPYDQADGLRKQFTQLGATVSMRNT